MLDSLERFVVPIDMRLSFFATGQSGNSERMYIKLADLIAGANQPEKLPLGGFQGFVRHHVQQADMQGANVLVSSAFHAQNFFTFFLETLKRG